MWRTQPPRILLLLLTLLAPAAFASNWNICLLDAKINAIKTKDYPRLEAQIVQVTPETASVECPTVGEIITFNPETMDYQRIVPRRQWPKKGESVQIRYRYIDGICKEDGREDYPCRIKHYPLVRQ
ncbi:hypothetical protein C9426_20640 [Serratia sp. S1B]|nr:hypothetical protein C9426_20640 [Serratia sp. S1B]